MAPLAPRIACGICLALGLADLAWLDTNANHLHPAPPAFPARPADAVPSGVPPSVADAPPVSAPLQVSAALVAREEAPAPPEITVHFAIARADLADAEAVALAPIARALVRDRDAVVQLDGHADQRGAPLFNLGLSARRADGVAHWLVAHGVHDDQIRTRAFGDTQPIDLDDSDDARGRNRRVEIHVLAKGAP